MKRWRYLWPGFRRSEEREMAEEFAALEEIAGRRELGNLTLAAENARGVWGWTWLESLGRDARYAVRVLARQPSFSVVAVVSLGLGIGANAAIYSLMDALLWRQLPVRDPQSLVRFEDGSYSVPKFVEYSAKSGGVLEGIAATTGSLARDLDAGAGAQRGKVEMVSGNYFGLLGASTLLGRTLEPEDDRPAAQGAAVLSYSYWQRAFAGDTGVVGKTVRVGGVPYAIAGVARPEFFGVMVGDAADAWLPMQALPSIFPGQEWFDSHHHYLELIARLRPGVSVSQASAALTPIAVAFDLADARPGMPEWLRERIRGQQLKLAPASNGISYLRARFSKPLRVLFAMVGIGLLLACVNVMGLGFARAEGRRQELRVRLAIGAGRTRIVRQLVTEALVVAVAGGALGLALYRPAAASLAKLLSQNIEPRLDANLMLYVLLISLAAGLVCGVAPAIGSTRQANGLQQGSRGVTHAPSRRLVGRLATAVQISLSVILIAGAFLFAFSLQSLTSVNTGVDRRGLVVMDVDAKDVGYKGPQLASLNQRLLERIAAIPGVERASYSGNGLYTGRNSNTMVRVDGFPPGDKEANMSFLDHVGPAHFSVAGTRIVAGRDFDERDNAAGPRVAIVNQEFVRHFLDGQNPLGKNIYRGREEQPYQIVGVSQDILTDVRKTPKRMFYMAHLQTRDGLYTTRFLIRSRAGQDVRAADLRAAVRAVDSSVNVVSIDTASTLLNKTLDTDRAIAALSFAFGLLAITLAAVGIYGLLAHDVTRRTSEIGIRMALGATRPGVMALVFREVALVGLVGMAAGALGTSALGKLVAGMAFGWTPGDPRVIAAAIALLAVVAAVAAWFPARRAATMDPTSALRHE